MIKGLLISIDSDGAPSVVKEGVPSLLTQEARKCRKASDFPKDVVSYEVWTPDNGCIDRVSKTKIEAQEKHNAKAAKLVNASKEKPEPTNSDPVSYQHKGNRRYDVYDSEGAVVADNVSLAEAKKLCPDYDPKA